MSGYNGVMKSCGVAGEKASSSQNGLWAPVWTMPLRPLLVLMRGAQMFLLDFKEVSDNTAPGERLVWRKL